MEQISDFFVRKHPTKRGLIFVIMPFSGELQSVYEFVLKPFFEEMGMECLRADEVYSTRPIMQDVWESIQSAEIVLADLTDRNPNVLYELGLCHALWKRVIIISQKIEDVPFDLKGYHLIPYESSIGGAVRLKESLRQTIEALRREKRKEGQIIPYEQEESSYGPLTRADATVEAVAKDYLRLRLADGRKAQMSIDEFSWTTKLKDLSYKFKVGDTVNGVLISETTTPVTFSIKQKWDDPWPDLKAEFPIGKKVVGRVTNENKYGLFVEIKKFFSGLVPRRNLPENVSFGVGQEVEVIVRQINATQRNILLEYSGKVEDQWAEKVSKYSVGNKYPGKVIFAKETYILVELEPDVQCIAHISNFPKGVASDLREKYPVDSEVDWFIKSIDPSKRQIQLKPAID